jgi:hypothetical protein
MITIAGQDVVIRPGQEMAASEIVELAFGSF